MCHAWSKYFSYSILSTTRLKLEAYHIINLFRKVSVDIGLTVRSTVILNLEGTVPTIVEK